MKLGLIGVQGAGKTTVFQLLTHGKLATPPAPNLATIHVPDPRLGFLAEIFKPKKTTCATIELLDPPGFTKTNLASLQTVDALIYVVPLFGRFENPAKTLQDLRSELMLRDGEMCESALGKTREPHECELVQRCSSALLESKGLVELELNESDEKLLRGFGFLTRKPDVVMLNVDDEHVSTDSESISSLQLNAKLELEISELTDEERKEFENELGMGEPPLLRFVKTCLPALEMISFFTAVGNELRAWLMRRGDPVTRAAGKVHSDMERGFIRADVIGFEDFKTAGSFKNAKDKGLLRTVKQDYVVKDGDIIEFKFKA